MDKIFDGIGEGMPRDYSNADTDYESRVRAMIEDARDYMDMEVAPDREEDTEYFHGLKPALDVEGRSSIVSTEVKETVYAILPSLIRIFTAHENIAEFQPNSEATVELAAQQTDYINHVFWEDNEGFLILHSVFKDALIRKTGVVTWWTDNEVEIDEPEYTNLDPEQLMYLRSQFPDAEVVKAAPFDQELGLLPFLKLRIKKDKPIHCVEAIPPDEFRIDRNARYPKKADLIGWERLMPASDLVKQGYDRELVEKHTNSGMGVIWNEERTMRNAGLDMEGFGRDSNNGLVLYGTYWIRIDKDDDGVAELRKICVMGDECEIVKDDIASYPKIAVWCPDPEPHTVVGHSIAELLRDLQKIRTSILRNALDSLSQTIFPRTVVNETLTNIDDVLNEELGAVIRTKGNVRDAVAQMENVFVGAPAFDMLKYMDVISQRRTGISEASKGLDPKALQSTSVVGVDMVLTGAQERIELIARILAETGFKDLFKGLLREVTDNPAKVRTLRLRGKWTNVFPGRFDPTLDVKVNSAIGRGSDTDRLNTLLVIKSTQEAIMEKFGPVNPFVTPMEYRNTLEDILAIANIKNVARHFRPITPEVIQQIQAASQPKPDPATIIAQAEVERIRADTAESVGKLERQRLKDQMDEDFRRDKLETDAAIKMTEIQARSEQAANVETIRAINASDRTNAQIIAKERTDAIANRARGAGS